MALAVIREILFFLKSCLTVNHCIGAWQMSLIAFWPKPSSLVFIFVFLSAQVLDDMLPASKRTEMLDLEELIEEKVSLRMFSLDLFFYRGEGEFE